MLGTVFYLLACAFFALTLLTILVAGLKEGIKVMREIQWKKGEV